MSRNYRKAIEKKKDILLYSTVQTEALYNIIHLSHLSSIEHPALLYYNNILEMLSYAQEYRQTAQ
jgi:hypothetical protein